MSLISHCPDSGQPHFYIVTRHMLMSIDSVNALTRANPISTCVAWILDREFYGVNALTRANPISTHFEETIENLNKKCQCPNSGQPHFYREKHRPTLSHEYSVNALTRANPISTLRSGKPHKQRLPEPIFTCNSQNILTISFFSS